MWVGEDEIIRGERERPGPLVKWNEDGTVCEERTRRRTRLRSPDPPISCLWFALRPPRAEPPTKPCPS